MKPGKKKILCVDDDVDDLLFLAETIHTVEPNLQVVELKNGLEAINYLNKAKADQELPCLIILDINMPFLDGRQTLDKIRSEMELENLPVVILSSSKNPQDKMLFRSKGVEMYTKPNNIKDLHFMVREFLTHCI